jgi:hypothetical protein
MILKKINDCKTMPELDKLRLESVQEMRKAESEEEGSFKVIQNAFKKKKNQLLRVPWEDRDW